MTISKTYVIVITHNGVKWIDKCFNSLKYSSIPLKIIVIDNASIDGTPKIIREKFPNDEVIETEQNLGFSKANNIGLKKILNEDFDYVFLLNQDAWIEKDTIKKLVEVFMSNPDAGIVSPIHLNGNYSGLDNGFSNYLTNDNTPGYISDLYIGNLKPSYKTNFVNAAAWLISRKCIETAGVFDTSLFCHYGEDDNYCQRVRFHNFGIYIATDTTICHDRENRNPKRPEIFEEKNQNLNRKLYYSNPFLGDSIIDEQIDYLRRKFDRKVIKYALTLNIKKLVNYRKNKKDELEFFQLIKNSRNSYKTDGLCWLKNLSSEI